MRTSSAGWKSCAPSAGRAASVAVRLLDTNIISYFFRRHPLAAHYAQHRRGQVILVSFMSVAEMYEQA
jgi:hypothetical protein